MKLGHDVALAGLDVGKAKIILKVGSDVASMGVELGPDSAEALGKALCDLARRLRDFRESLQLPAGEEESDG